MSLCQEAVANSQTLVCAAFGLRCTLLGSYSWVLEGCFVFVWFFLFVFEPIFKDLEILPKGPNFWLLTCEWNSNPSPHSQE